jgi:hypothetical protein
MLFVILRTPLKMWHSFLALNLNYYMWCISVHLRKNGTVFSLFVTSCQYNETNVMYFSFSLLRIKGLYMFRSLLAHSQEMLHKRHLVHCLRVMSVGCYQDWSGTGIRDTSSTPILVQQSNDITRSQYTKCRLFSTSWGWVTNARNV